MNKFLDEVQTEITAICRLIDAQHYEEAKLNAQLLHGYIGTRRDGLAAEPGTQEPELVLA